MVPNAPVASSQRRTPPHGPPNQPAAYCPIPQRLITDLHDTPLAIGLYGFIARLYLVNQVPILLSVPDVLRYDPTLSRGAVLRALARLVAGGYLVEAPQAGRKTRYTPAWGFIRGTALAWDMRQPCLGRPRHVARLRLDRRLFDICMGKLVPHPTRTAPITRYITTPVLTLADIGCYALTLAGLPHATPALTRLGAVQAGEARALPGDQQLLALISQRALDLDAADGVSAELTLSGTRKLGVTPLLASEPGAAAAQPLFFVPPGMIGCLIDPMIGSMIGADRMPIHQEGASASDPAPSNQDAAGITWELRDPGDDMIPPPSPPTPGKAGGGGIASDQKTTTSTPRRQRRAQSAAPLPQTEAALALQTINVHPAQIAELAHLPAETIAAAIADGQVRPGIRDLAGWVVCLLRTHRDYGWKIAPPTPSPESPEALRAAFARYATEHGADPATAVPDQGDAASPAPAPAEHNVAQLWGVVLASLRTRVARPALRDWIQPARLLKLDQGIAILGVPGVAAKEQIENHYAGVLREVLEALVGSPLQLRLMIHAEACARGRNDYAPGFRPL